MSEQVAALLKDFRACGWRIATAESCTGGLVAAAITDIAGSSDVFERGVVTYSNEAKCDLLGVNPGTLAAYGAVSEPVALEMAEGLLASSPADVAISVTGIAGPGGSENKPEGRVCFGLGVRNRNTHTETVEFGSLGRAAVRKAAVERALDLLHSAVRLR